MYEICQLPNPFVAIQTIPEGNLLFYQACFTVEPSYVFVFDNLCQLGGQSSMRQNWDIMLND